LPLKTITKMHEVMILDAGDVLTLRLRRPDRVGPIDLPKTYISKPDATRAAYDFIRDRRKTHPVEEWFCKVKEN
jgi:hypothetical protein